MYCTVKEIIRDVLDTDVPDSECVFAVVLTRGDVRHIAQDWNLSDDELEFRRLTLPPVMRRLYAPCRTDCRIPCNGAGRQNTCTNR